MSKRIGLIWAEARGGAIGRGGTMPWHLPEDLAHFKRVTLGAPVIMGRRTWESLPDRFRPLPGRENIVITRNASYEASGATVRSSLGSAIARLDLGDDSDTHTVWVMGGGELYRSALPLADELWVTRIGMDVPDADTFAPEIGEEWVLADPGACSVSTTGLEYRFERWLRG